jgi:hypothetical protein
MLTFFFGCAIIEKNIGGFYGIDSLCVLSKDAIIQGDHLSLL